MTSPSATDADFDAAPGSVRRAFGVGSSPFVLTLAMCIAVTALGVDAMLPAYPEIRDAMGLAPDATSVTRIISYYLLGNSLGLLPAGLLADRFGRRPVMWGGLALYALGAIGTMLAPSLTAMFVFRFVWGLGAAGPRVAAMAMVRDAYEGAQMARQMSFIMAVFILVPMFAPALSAGVLELGAWTLVPAICAALAVVVALAVAGLGESLPVSSRRSLAAAEIWRGYRIVFATPGTIAYLVAMTALFSVFISFLASSEVVLDQVFGFGSWFPLYFGGLAAMMGLGMLANGRVVGHLGLDTMIRRTFAGSATAVVVLLVLTLLTDGRPPFWPYVAALGLVLFANQMLIPNLNAAAMRPLAHVAGSAAAVVGMVPGVLGSLIGGLIDDRFDGTVTPLSVAFAVASAVAALAWRAAAQRSAPAD